MQRPDVRATVIETVLGRAAQAGVDDVALIAANGLNRRMTPAELQRLLGERVFRSFFADGLLRNHDAEDADDLASLGTTEAGEVSINARVAASDLVIFVHVVADRRHTTGRELLAGIGSAPTSTAARATSSDAAAQLGLINSAVPIFQIDVVLDNDVFPAGLAFLSKREWEWSIREQVAWRGIRRGLSVAPARVRRKVINRSQATFSPTAVFAGDPAAVTRQAGSASATTSGSRCRTRSTWACSASASTPRTAWTLRSIPILAAWQGLVGLLGAHTGRSLVRDGGAVIIYHPMPNDFSPLHHPSYVDFYADVLTRTADREQIRADVEPKFAGDPWYAHLYRTSQAFHGVHPLLLWYEIEAAKQNYGDVVFVGADRFVIDRLGFRAASTLADALEIVSSGVGRSPTIGYLHAPPQILVDVS